MTGKKLWTWRIGMSSCIEGAVMDAATDGDVDLKSAAAKNMSDMTSWDDSKILIEAEGMNGQKAEVFYRSDDKLSDIQVNAQGFGERNADVEKDLKRKVELCEWRHNPNL